MWRTRDLGVKLHAATRAREGERGTAPPTRVRDAILEYALLPPIAQELIKELTRTHPSQRHVWPFGAMKM